jgi:hypothetical protein
MHDEDPDLLILKGRIVRLRALIRRVESLHKIHHRRIVLFFGPRYAKFGFWLTLVVDGARHLTRVTSTG